MKTVIFISTRQLESYQPEIIANYPELRCVLLLSEAEYASFAEARYVIKFEKVYAIQAAPETRLLDQYNYEQAHMIVAQEVELLSQDIPLDQQLFIITQDEANVVTAAKLREAFNLKGVHTKQAEIFRNKLSMKTYLSSKNIPVPKFDHFDHQRARQHTQHYFSHLTELLGLPFVVKPATSAGSDSVFIIRQEPDFSAMLSALDATLPYDVETFIEGKLYHCDSVIANGKIEYIGVCEYSCPTTDFQKGYNLGSILLPKNHPDAIIARAFAETCLQAMGLPNGCQHLEMFMTADKQCIFLEVAVRAPGIVAAKMYANNLGLSLPSMELNNYLSPKASLIIEEKHSHCFWLAIPKKNGVVKDLVQPNFKDVHVDAQWLVKVGDRLTSARSNIDIAGIVFGYHDNFDVLYEQFIQLHDANFLMMEEGSV